MSDEPLAGPPPARADRATGDDVLDWLRGPEARRSARRRLRGAGLPAHEVCVDDVLADATVAVLRRMASPDPLLLDNPAAYGTVTVRNVVNATTRGRDVLVDLQAPEAVTLLVERSQGSAPGAPDGVLVDDRFFEDDLRTAVEHLGGPAWLSSATLALLTFTITPADPPPGAPTPIAGATPVQASCWSALWLAGVRDVFRDRSPVVEGERDGAARRRRRARRVGAVTAHLERAHAHLRAAAGPAAVGRGDEEVTGG